MVKVETTEMPDAVDMAVKEAASEEMGAHPQQLKIVEVEKRTWPNGCLGVPQPGEYCPPAKVEGWRVVISDGSHTLVYRTSLSGDRLRQEIEDTYSGKLPPEVAEMVLQDVQQRSGEPIYRLQIVEEEQNTWPDSCLGLPEPGEVCAQMLVDGWRVVVENHARQWSYRTSLSGGKIRLESHDSTSGKGKISDRLAHAVLQQTAKHADTSPSNLHLVEAEPRTWNNTCLGLPQPGEVCEQQPMEGWRIVVENDCQTWVYRSDRKGSNIRLETPYHTAVGNLPPSVSNAVLHHISQQSGMSPLGLRIVEAERETWPDRCLGLAEKPEESSVEEALVAGWRVMVCDRDRAWTYRTDRDGSTLRIEK